MTVFDVIKGNTIYDFVLHCWVFSLKNIFVYNSPNFDFA
jgi:hypothetical protein